MNTNLVFDLEVPDEGELDDEVRPLYISSQFHEALDSEVRVSS